MILIAIGCTWDTDEPGNTAPDTAADLEDSDIPAEDSDIDCHDSELDSGVVALSVRADALAALPSGTCGALLDPWVMGEPGDTLGVLAQILEFRGVSGSGADMDSCPCYGQMADWDCRTSDGTAVVGYAWGSGGSSGWGGGTYAAFGAVRDDGDGRFDLLMDGYAGASGSSLSKNFGDLREALGHAGVHDEGFNGTSIRDGGLSTVNGWAVAEAFYLMVVADDRLPTGDLCLDVTLDNVATCPDEPVGILRVVGAQDVTITYDGDVACDGCGSVAIEGVAAGQICDAIPKDWAGD